MTLGTGRADAGVKWQAPKSCLPAALLGAVESVGARRHVVVTSTYRNRGLKGSYHRRCKAIDFRVLGSSRAVLQELRGYPGVGATKHYGGGLYHIDTGPKWRRW
jgi:uncharacterized protein YcbK (DUF882 family)